MRNKKKHATTGAKRAPVVTTPSQLASGTTYYGREVHGTWLPSDGIGIFQRRNRTIAVPLVQPVLPQVHISAYANAIMWSIVDQVPVEASWYATAIRDEHGDIIIDDVYIPHHTGSSGLTTITEDGEAFLMEELLAEPDGAEIIQNLACWGHSHHSMGVFASGQDEAQARELIQRREDFYVRLIMNKRGDLNATVYLIDEGIEVREAVCIAEPIDPETLPEIYRWVAEELAEKHRRVDGYSHHVEVYGKSGTKVDDVDGDTGEPTGDWSEEIEAMIAAGFIDPEWVEDFGMYGYGEDGFEVQDEDPTNHEARIAEAVALLENYRNGRVPQKPVTQVVPAPAHQQPVVPAVVKTPHGSHSGHTVVAAAIAAQATQQEETADD